MEQPYDALAGTYEITHQAPLRRYIEAFTFFKLVGEVEGQTVLDLACGDGMYSRELKRRGAARVVGVDISEGMLELARAKERLEPRGIEYLSGDVAQSGVLGEFELVTAVYLLHYARTKEELYGMTATISRNLKPGGRLVSICANPWFRGNNPQQYQNYGLFITHEEPLYDGAVMHAAIRSGELKADFNSFYWSAETYEAALQAAGFKEIDWHPPEVEPQGIRELGEQYWQSYLANPHLIGLTCHK